MDTNRQNIACLDKIMPIFNKQHFMAQFIKKLSSTEAVWKKCVAFKKVCIVQDEVFVCTIKCMLNKTSK